MTLCETRYNTKVEGLLQKYGYTLDILDELNFTACSNFGMEKQLRFAPKPFTNNIATTKLVALLRISLLIYLFTITTTNEYIGYIHIGR